MPSNLSLETAEQAEISSILNGTTDNSLSDMKNESDTLTKNDTVDDCHVEALGHLKLVHEYITL